ncbi:MAG: 16S rRNA (guanine(966)-N(2))-methyltransferase RsmD [Bacteroidia bacterium]|nr:16S rRNA (guanine(966)-N(2))-methyltransferase RsmD [Bacteroidia bacterium]
MRIISGKYGGRHFTPPKGLDLRPTTERSRESLFNILAHRHEMEGARVLELFSGTGIVGMEFLSRGASSLIFVEKDGRQVAFTQKCLKELGENQAKVLKMPAEKYVDKCNESFDFIFLDPPYELAGQRELIEKILKKGLLKPDGILIHEHRSKYSFEDLPGFVEARKYGEATFSFFSGEDSA